MQKQLTFIALGLILVCTLVLPASLVRSQNQLEACKEMAFSTEEDFISFRDDVGLYVSDGDLLGPNGVVCAHNWELLRGFEVPEHKDLGLDAADVLDADGYLVAFSTELDNQGEFSFTAGDLLVTNGAIIANQALLYLFDVRYDIGLDAVHFVGARDEILSFLDQVQEYDRSYWMDNASTLHQLLDRYKIDIWFSTEGTWWLPDLRTPFLDGDLLSARDGTVVVTNGKLLPNYVPADIRDDGVDFGLDAFAAHTRDEQEALEKSFFSTEILFNDREGARSFTDGDQLDFGDGVFKTNQDLIAAFKPRADELGLDALSLPIWQNPPDCYGALLALGGNQTPVAALNASGLAQLGYPTRHPFGNDVPFWGYLADCVTKFRVVYRPEGDTGSGTPILPGTWQIGDPSTWNPATHQCEGTMARPSPGVDQYYDAAQYRALLKCDPLPFTNWHTPNASDPNGHYEVRLDWKSTAGTFHGPWHNVQLDNENPEIIQLAVQPQGGGGGGTTQCPIYSPTDMPMMLQGEFKDDHFWYYRATIDGDLLPAHHYTVTHYYDGTPAALHLDDTGTTPDGALVDLHDVSVYDLTGEPPDCCYSVRVRIWDRTIWGNFAGYRAVISGYVGRWDQEDDIYFAFQP